MGSLVQAHPEAPNNASLAQLVEQLTINQWVQGSNPWGRTLGEMAEWSIAPVLKTDVLRGTGGSNPSLSAESKIDDF